MMLILELTSSHTTTLGCTTSTGPDKAKGPASFGAYAPASYACVPASLLAGQTPKCAGRQTNQHERCALCMCHTCVRVRVWTALCRVHHTYTTWLRGGNDEGIQWTRTPHHHLPPFPPQQPRHLPCLCLQNTPCTHHPDAHPIRPLAFNQF